MPRRLTSFICSENSGDLEQVTDLIEAGKVTPTIDKTYALHRASEAMRYLEAGKARGKIAISL